VPARPVVLLGDAGAVQQPARQQARHVERWLGLRLMAWLRNLPFDELQVTPRLLARIDARRCPVAREPLTLGASARTDAVVALLHEPAGVVAGNLAVMSRGAAQAAAGVPAPPPWSRPPSRGCRRCAPSSLPRPTRRPPALPLAVLPPPRVRGASTRRRRCRCCSTHAPRDRPRRTGGA
jgi:hypothetical protein